MRYYIIAGEASGDLHGANLIRALFRHDPDAEIRYWGGDQMAAACRETGVSARQMRHINSLAYMGFIEVVVHLRTILNNIKFCKQICNLLPVGLNAHAGGIVFLIDFGTLVNYFLLDW